MTTDEKFKAIGKKNSWDTKHKIWNWFS